MSRKKSPPVEANLVVVNPRAARALAIMPATVTQDVMEAHLDQWRAAEEGLTRFTLLAQVMQGFCLLELQTMIQRPGTRTDLTSPQRAERLNWADYVKKRFGFCDDKARRLMQIRKMAATEQRGLVTVLDKPISQMNAAEQASLKRLTQKLTDGETQASLRESLGLDKGAGGKGTGGKRDAKVKLTPDEEQAAQLRLARAEWEDVLMKIDLFFTNLHHTRIPKDLRTQMAGVFTLGVQKLQKVGD
jgi:hypothetical protein